MCYMYMYVLYIWFVLLLNASHCTHVLLVALGDRLSLETGGIHSQL